jgi:PAS domain S-box-containing protein
MRSEPDIGILDVMDSGVYIVGPRLQIEYVNPAMLRDFGPVEGRSCHLYLHGLPQTCPWCENQEVFSGRTLHREWNSAKTGKTYSACFTPYQSAAGEICKLAILHDVTRHKLAEKAVSKQNEELERRVRERTGALEKANSELTALNSQLERRHFEAETARSALQLASEKYRLLFDNCNDGILIHDMHGRMLEANPTTIQRLGYTHAELLSMVLDQVDAQEQGREVPGRMASLREQGHLTFESVHRRKDGSTIATEISARLITWDAQPAVLSICRDITDRKQLADELSIKNNQLQFLMQHIPDPIWLKDVDGVYLDCNRRFEQLYGARQADIVGKTDYDFVEHEQADFFRLNDRSAMLAGTPRSNEEWLTFADNGQRILMETVKAPVQNGSGEVIGVLGISRDITKRKQLEEALTSSLSLLDATLESTADGILVVDLQGNIKRWNRKFSDLWGIPEGMLSAKLDRPLLAHVASLLSDPEQFIGNVAELYGHPDRSSTDTLRLADGRVFERYTQPQSNGADIMGRVWSFRDITRSKAVEQEMLVARDAARAASLAKSEFLANMSHEIRNPMTGVLGMAQLLSFEELTGKQRQYLDVLIASGTAMMSLINDILDLSKVEAEMVELELSEFSLHTCIAEVVQTQKAALAGKGLTLELDLDAKLPAVMVGDPLRVKRIILNLVGNAVKFTARGGISISTQLVDGQDDRLLVRVAVRDSGIGTGAGDAERIFLPMVQGDSSITRRFGGTGLGLAISKKLAALMGGSIGVANNEAGGATFWFTMALHGKLPAPVGPEPRPAPAQDTQPPAAGPPGKGRDRILLVDDDPVSREVTTLFVSLLGFPTDCAQSGPEALRMLSEQAYDLVLLDCMMPGMSGFEVVARVRDPGSSVLNHGVPVIALTANAMKGERTRCLQAGMDDYLSKPIILEKMSSLLTKWLSAPPTRITTSLTAPDLKRP